MCAVVNHKNNAVILVLVLISGACVMSIEMLGGRILAPYFGSSVYVWGSLIFTFMVGLSLGYGVGGRLSISFHGLHVLAIVLLFAGFQVAMLAVLSEPVLNLTFERTSDPRTGSLLASMLLYLIPTATMGTVSPIAIRTVSDRLDEVGSRAGTLYLVSTFGSAFGTLVTSFWLVAKFEVNTIVYGNAALLIFAAALGGVTYRFGRKNDVAS